MPSKIFRDPLYNYISIDTVRDPWLVPLLNCPEIQRLRRIHQLGVSDITYPGASHTRFAHTLGVLHLMQQMYEQIEKAYPEEQIKIARARLLASAVLHDVGHGPFSHLFETCLDLGSHEDWSVKIVQNTDGAVHKILTREIDSSFPGTVAQLIEKDNFDLPRWQKFLLSSQLDVDRMDYLRRDSLFTGAGYGHFDWYRLINTLQLHKEENRQYDIVWPEKAKFAIEEFIYSRFYMYQNVYLHKTTRGFEKLLEAMWNRAKELLRDDDSTMNLVPAIDAFWSAENPTVEQYLAIEEFTVLQQIRLWTEHRDEPLQDLARRFLERDYFAMIEPPPRPSDDLTADSNEWEEELRKVVRKEGFEITEAYCLKDKLKGKFYEPYFAPEKESDEQSALNTIRVLDGGEPVEISKLLTRLELITKTPPDRFRYYVPRQVRRAAEKLRHDWTN